MGAASSRQSAGRIRRTRSERNSDHSGQSLSGYAGGHDPEPRLIREPARLCRDPGACRGADDRRRRGQRLRGRADEVIVADGSSEDRTVELAEAAAASGDVLCFLHADVRLTRRGRLDAGGARRPLGRRGQLQRALRRVAARALPGGVLPRDPAAGRLLRRLHDLLPPGGVRGGREVPAVPADGGHEAGESAAARRSHGLPQ